MDPKMQEKIVLIAKQYVGQTEKPKNTGFTNEHFEAKMKAVGFTSGQAWCAYFVELVYKEAGVLPFAELDKLHSASATKTLQNYKEAGYLILQDPLPGCIAIWQHGDSWKGHAAIVDKKTDPKSFKTIEGNSNDKGGREGYIVTDKLLRKLGMPFNTNGLNLLGFICPSKK